MEMKLILAKYEYIIIILKFSEQLLYLQTIGKVITMYTMQLVRIIWSEKSELLIKDYWKYTVKLSPLS